MGNSRKVQFAGIACPLREHRFRLPIHRAAFDNTGPVPSTSQAWAGIMEGSLKLFDVSVKGLKKIQDLPDSWSETDYRSLLRDLEIDGVDDLGGSDLYDVLLMALQDLGAEQAGELVLAHKLKQRVSRGVRENIVQDLLEGQRAWEENSNLYLHADIFAASVLLYAAFPAAYPKPDMMRLDLRLWATGSTGKNLLAEPPEAAFVARMLADGMSEKSILERLFGKQLAGRSFPEAEGIIWRAEFGEHSADGTETILTVYSSRHWLQAMAEVDDFPSSAYDDRPGDEEDEDED